MDYDISNSGFETPESYRLVREIFSQAGYDAKGLAELFGGWFPTAPTAVDMQGLVRQVRGHSRIETLVRLFLLNVPVDVKTAQQILKPMKLEQWARAGILKRDIQCQVSQGKSIRAGSKKEVRPYPFQPPLRYFT